jgi:hypothetical protein
MAVRARAEAVAHLSAEEVQVLGPVAGALTWLAPMGWGLGAWPKVPLVPSP